MSLKFVPKVRVNNIPALVQIMPWHRPGDKPLSESMMVSLLTYICVTWPQRVNNTIMFFPEYERHFISHPRGRGMERLLRTDIPIYNLRLSLSCGMCSQVMIVVVRYGSFTLTMTCIFISIHNMDNLDYRKRTYLYINGIIISIITFTRLHKSPFAWWARNLCGDRKAQNELQILWYFFYKINQTQAIHMCKQRLLCIVVLQ